MTKFKFPLCPKFVLLLSVTMHFPYNGAEKERLGISSTCECILSD